MDNWTETRTFWTFGGAVKFFAVQIWGTAHIYRWSEGRWIKFGF